MIRSLRYCAFIVSFLGLVHLSAQVKFDYLSSVGIIVLQNNGTACLTIKNPDLSVGTQFMVVFPSMSGNSIPSELMRGEIVRRTSGGCNFSESAEYGDSTYTVKITKGKLINDVPYIAVFVSPETLSKKGKEIVGDLDSDGTLEYFRQCTSSEGVHLTIWSGKPLKGIRKWHRYFYLGYDVEPSCNEADYSEK
jgi:hypothetical protein